MKNIILKELTISNFKGINARHVFGDNENIISGKNASGKSTIIRAWNWLLSGKSDANTVSNDNLFDNRQPITKDTPTASVKAVITIDGEKYTLERTATAAFTRKRGTDEYVKSASDNYKFYIDEIERSTTDFKAWLSEMICSDDMMQYVLDGSYFITKVFDDKKGARQIIEKVVGTVTREEMMCDYSDIDELLQKYTPDEIDIQSANLAKCIEKRLDEIPALIRNNEKEISEIEQIDFNETEKAITSFEAEREELNRQLLDITARIKPLLDAKAKAEQDCLMKASIYDKAKEEYEKGWIEQDNKLCLEISKIEEQNRILNFEKKQLCAMNATDEKQIQEYEDACQKLRDEKDAIKKEVFDCNDICPVCGAPLSEETKEKEHAAWEKRQREKIDGLVLRGREINGWIYGIKDKIGKRITKMNEMVIVDVKPLKESLYNLRSKDILPFAETEQGKALQADIDAVVIPTVKIPEDEEIHDRIKQINEKLIPLYERRGLKFRLQSLKNTTEALRTEQREKGSELAKYERRRVRVKQFKQEQMKILSHKVNDGLQHSRIEVWSQQKDGTQVPDLVIKDANGVRFESTNNASRIITTCDIQRFFCDKLGVNMPVFVDECSVLDSENLPLINNVQMFYLLRADTALHIETK